ncbi:glycosyltransferase [Mycetocola reblochoni]|uniref:Glycosyltransferase n=2 Tax=Mycetocola reblochoni TaxID=331618 RepID=A0A1R4K8L2_9MICO|nr:glycosyltransferase [Mycetocola reblochoni]RLP68087.1 colanic acid biosynthesis glycosyltransferase WcaL [Mycetocola reblochoni]SJN40660.1 Glycosyltransferase [Mycetocola reblochoni REB411]
MFVDTTAPTAADGSVRTTEGTPRIGYVVKVYPRFSETFVVTEILARERRGERLTVFALRPTTDGHFHAELAEVAAPVVHLQRPGSRAALWQALAEARRRGARMEDVIDELLAAEVDDAVQACLLAAEVITGRITHLHAHFATAAGRVARLAAAMTGIGYSVTAHAKDIYHRDVDRGVLRTLIADAHHVVTVSDVNLRHLRALAPEHAARIHRVYNGVDSERFPFREEPAGTGDALHVVAVGRLVEKKGFEVLIEAARIAGEAGLDLRVDIVGEGERRESLQAQIRRSGLEGRVRLLGARTQDGVRELLTRADVFAAPSVEGADGNIDGLPTVLLEAMALGVPAVSTTVAGIPEAIDDGVHGLLVAEADPHALGDALRRLADDPHLGRRLAVSARDRVVTRFATSRQAERLAALVTDGAPTVHVSPDGAPAIDGAPATAASSPVRAEGVLR